LKCKNAGLKWKEPKISRKGAKLAKAILEVVDNPLNSRFDQGLIEIN